MRVEKGSCTYVFYQQIENGNIANQIQGFTIDYGKFILKLDRNTVHVFCFLNKTWVFDQSERTQGPIYITITNKLVCI